MNRPRQTPLKRIEQYLQDYTIRKKIRFYMSTVFLCIFSKTEGAGPLRFVRIGRFSRAEKIISKKCNRGRGGSVKLVVKENRIRNIRKTKEEII